MKVIEHLNNANGKTLFTLEILPPLKGENIQSVYDVLDPLMEHNPSYINITYHQQETVLTTREDGLIEKKTVRKRPGTVALAAAIKYKYPHVDVVPHMICGGYTREEAENTLIDLHFLGIDNILALRGDAEKSRKTFQPEPGGNANAIDLVNQIVDLNQGTYLDAGLDNKAATNFCIGVAGYPEKHAEAPNMSCDIEFLKQKVDAGADYIVTQMFFDNQKYFDFVDRCRAEGITVPIIPGLKPIAVMNQLTVLPQIFSLEIPEELAKEVRKCKNNAEVRQVGVEWTINQSIELMKHNVPALHYYTMGAGKGVQKIAKAIF